MGELCTVQPNADTYVEEEVSLLGLAAAGTWLRGVAGKKFGIGSRNLGKL